MAAFVNLRFLDSRSSNLRFVESKIAAAQTAIRFEIGASLNAAQRARDLAPVIDNIRSGGAVTLEAIAAELNGREMMTLRGGGGTRPRCGICCDGLRPKGSPAASRA